MAGNMFCGLLTGAIAALILYFIFNDYRYINTPAPETAHASGTYTGKSFDRITGNGHMHFENVAYTFTVNGVTYNGKGSTESDPNADLTLGVSPDVYYNPSNPADSTLIKPADAATKWSDEEGGMIFLGILALVFGYMTYVFFAAASIQRRNA